MERIELNGLKSSKAKNEETATREVAAEEPAGQKRELDATHPGENVTSTGAIMLALFGQKEEEEEAGHMEKEWMTLEWKEKEWMPMPKYVEMTSECVKTAAARQRMVVEDGDQVKPVAARAAVPVKAQPVERR